MKAIFNQFMAAELLTNEEMIKNQTGPYRPRFNPRTRMFEPVIKCFPLEPFKGNFPQEREVTPGMENEVDDIAIAKIADGKITYKVNDHSWYPVFNPFTNSREALPLKEYSVMIYHPNMTKDTIFITEDTLGELFSKLKEFQVVSETDEEARIKGRMSYPALFENIDDWFKKYQGICTYILFKGDSIWKCGKFDNKKYW